MKLRFILGISGSGKTKLCTDEIIKHTAEGGSAVYIVPEQYSLASEQLLSEKSSNGVLMHSEVISFAHLAHRVLLKNGSSGDKILDDSGKALLLRKITGELIKKDKLVFYGKSAARQGFADSISALITEFVRYAVTPEEILSKSEVFAETDRPLADKLHDIGTVYAYFKQSVASHYIAKDSLLDVLAEKIPQSGLMNGKQVWIDSFTDFTPQEFSVIKALLQVCDRVTISLTVQNYLSGAKLDRYDPYYEAKRSIRQIRRIAEEIGAVCEPTVFLDEDKRHSPASDLKHLAHTYFDGKHYDGTSENIRLYSASSIESEVGFAAGEILSLLRGGYSCSDIAVLVSSDAYNMPLKRVFESYGIPYFTDVKRDIMSHPLTELVRSLFRTAETNMSTEQVFRLLKTGFNDFERDEIAFAENYCIACGIRGKKWFDDWQYTVSGRYDEQAMNDLNDMRGYIADMLEHILSLRDKDIKTVEQYSAKVYELMDYFGVRDKLSELTDTAKADGDEDAVRLHSRVWDIIGDLFSKLCEIMGEDKITLSDYAKLVESGLQNAALGLIPPTCDSVTVAEFNRSRLPSIKALFMLGVNEGIVPPHHDDANLLSDKDRAELAGDGCELGGDSLRLINRDRYTVYADMTKPSERLYLSYNTALESGVASSLIKDVSNTFGIEVREIFKDARSVDGIYSDEQAYELLLRHIAQAGDKRDISPLYRAVYAHLYKNEKYRDRLEELKTRLNFADPTEEELTEELAKQLYLERGQSLVSGITSLQDYASCPYMYFMRHGLKAFDRLQYEPTALDYGTLLHSVLKQFSDGVRDGWQSLEDGYIKTEVGRLVDDYVQNHSAGFFADSAANKYMADRLKKTAVTAIRAFSQNIEGFVPCGYEISFGTRERSQLPPLKYELDSGARLVIEGSIDRVDLYTAPDNTTYVKITDYKTTESDGAFFSEDKLYLGVQLQLPLYMQAYLNGDKKASQGGFFYYKLSDPVFASAKENAFDKLIGGGVALDNSDVMSALSLEEQKKLSGRGKAFLKLSEAEISGLNDKVNQIITDIGEGIVSGNIGAHPYKTSSGASPCAYCDYSAVCCFELCSGKNKKYRTTNDSE